MEVLLFYPNKARVFSMNDEFEGSDLFPAFRVSKGENMWPSSLKCKTLIRREPWKIKSGDVWQFSKKKSPIIEAQIAKILPFLRKFKKKTFKNSKTKSSKISKILSKISKISNKISKISSKFSKILSKFSKILSKFSKISSKFSKISS